MKQPNRRTISVLFVAIALVLAVGPALGAAGATAPSVQEGGEDTDDGITDDTEDTGAQDDTNETDGTTDHETADAGESQTRITIDRITIDRISTDHLTMENVTIEGLNITTSAAEAMFGQTPADVDGVTVDNETDGVDNETDDGLVDDNETDDGLDNETDDGLDNETDDGLVGDNETDDGLDNETDDGLDNETDDGLDNETDDGLDNETDDEQPAEPNASVTFDDQETDGSTVTVESVNVSEGGFVTIHDSSLLEGATFDSVVGSSEYLEPGEHEDVEVQLFDDETVPGAEFDQDALEDNETLIAMPHLDTNDNETYDFLETDGEEDGPYTEDGEAVIDDAEITVVDDDADEATDGEETDDAEPSATLDVADQSGDGTTLEVAEASADEDFYVVANYDGETSESDEFNAVEERLDYSLTLDPPIEDDTTVEVAILSAADDEELTSQEIEYTVEDDGDADVEDGTDDGTTNETDGDATGVDGNESAALIA